MKITLTPNQTDEKTEKEMIVITVTGTKRRRKMVIAIFVNSLTIIGSVHVVTTTDLRGYHGVVDDQIEPETDLNVVMKRMRKMIIVIGALIVAGAVDEGLVHDVEGVVGVAVAVEGK